MHFQVCLMTSNSLLRGLFGPVPVLLPKYSRKWVKVVGSWTHCLIVGMLLAWVVLTNSYSLKIKSYKGWNRIASLYSNILRNQECPAVERQVATGAWYCSGSSQGDSLVRLVSTPWNSVFLSLLRLRFCLQTIWYAVGKHKEAGAKIHPTLLWTAWGDFSGDSFSHRPLICYWREWCVSWYFQGFDPVDRWELCDKNMWLKLRPKFSQINPRFSSHYIFQ